MSDLHPSREQARQVVLDAIRPSIVRRDPDGARRKAQVGLEVALLAVPRTSTEAVACAKGCAMCCHLRVAAMPVEVFGVVRYLRQQVAADALPAVVERIDATAARVYALPPEQLLTVNIPCPLLGDDGACSVYPARPFNCRAYHSLDVSACRSSFEEPANLSLGHPQSALIAAIHAGAQHGLRDGLRMTHVDATQYELVTALAEAFGDPECERRHAAGERPFEHAISL